MAAWAFYFLAKTWLHYRDHIRLDVLLNLVFLVLLALPLPRRLASSRAARAARRVAATAAAAALLWHESWLPTARRTAQLLAEAGRISPVYVARLLAGSFDRWDLLALSLLLAACILLARRITLTPVALAAILSVAVTGGRSAGQPGAGALERFFEAEGTRVVRFGAHPPGPPLDLVLLHVCSLSWSDLRAAGLDPDALLRRFDLVFTRFNTVSSYTNPSALRLLRAPCGQPRHRDLYREAPAECYLLDALRAQGYATWTALDNDAPASRFVPQVIALGHADPPLPLQGLPVRRRDFDATPIHDDLALLDRWWEARRRSPAPRALLYADLTTLHGGARRVDDPGWWKRSRAQLYREAAEELFGDLDRFFATLAASGRPVAVIFVPEHGMALRGSGLQPPDLRELPLPPITTVPVGVKLIGPGLPAAPARQVVVTRPTSYLALADLLRALVEAPRFDPEAMLTPALLDALPETPFVAENEAAVVTSSGEKFLLGKDGKWLELAPGAVGE